MQGYRLVYILSLFRRKNDGAAWKRETQKKGETFQLKFGVTREMFDFVEGIWEPPTTTEMLRYDGLRISEA